MVTSHACIVGEQRQESDVFTTLGTDSLRIGISTRALFDLEEEHRVFEGQGVHAYAKMQLDREDTIIGKGAGFEVVERLLALNKAGTPPHVEVIFAVTEFPRSFSQGFQVYRLLRTCD